jgi:hypothetical protein
VWDLLAEWHFRCLMRFAIGLLYALCKLQGKWPVFLRGPLTFRMTCPVRGGKHKACSSRFDGSVGIFHWIQSASLQWCPHLPEVVRPVRTTAGGRTLSRAPSDGVQEPCERIYGTVRLAPCNERVCSMAQREKSLYTDKKSGLSTCCPLSPQAPASHRTPRHRGLTNPSHRD